MYLNTTVQFMYSAADSTTGCTEGEVCDGTEPVAVPPLTVTHHTVCDGTEPVTVPPLQLHITQFVTERNR